MNSKKYIFFTLFLAFFALNAMAENRQFKSERRIYLWDVTLSMKGYNGSPNIYDPVVQAIKKDINAISDDQTEIVVLPFQTRVLESWQAKASTQGKAEIIGKIEKYVNEEVTYTNVNTPLLKVMDEYIDSDRRDVLVLLTDGVQNDPGTTMQDLIVTIRKWCKLAEEEDAYAFYVMLTQFATNESLISAIDATCRMDKIIMEENGGIDITFIELRPQERVLFNIKEDAGKAMSLAVTSKKSVTLPDNLKIKLESIDNPYVKVDQSAKIENGVLKFDVELLESYQTLKEQLPTDSNEEVIVTIEVEGDNPRIQLMDQYFTIELINKPEKTLRIYVKE
ncbi:MAG: VWA domain-containing protein [Rikenellaceae bacterium]